VVKIFKELFQLFRKFQSHFETETKKWKTTLFELHPSVLASFKERSTAKWLPATIYSLGSKKH